MSTNNKVLTKYYLNTGASEKIEHPGEKALMPLYEPFFRLIKDKKITLGYANNVKFRIASTINKTSCYLVVGDTITPYFSTVCFYDKQHAEKCLGPESLDFLASLTPYYTLPAVIEVPCMFFLRLTRYEEMCKFTIESREYLTQLTNNICWLFLDSMTLDINETIKTLSGITDNTDILNLLDEIKSRLAKEIKRT